MVSQHAVFSIAIICLTITSSGYTQEAINKESLLAADDLQRPTDKSGEKALNFDKLYGLAGDLKLQIRSLLQDMANDATDYVKKSIQDTAHGVYSTMRETTVLDVMRMMFDNMLGDTGGLFNQNFQQPGATTVPQAGFLGAMQKPDATLSDNSPVINIINQNAPLMSNNGSSAANQPGFQTSNQIFVFINNGSGIPDTANAVNVIDTLKPSSNTLGTINQPIITSGVQSTIVKPISDTDNKVTLAVIGNNDLNRPNVVASSQIFETNDNILSVSALPGKPIAAAVKPVKPSIPVLSPVVLGTNDNDIHSSTIQKPDLVFQTLFTKKPSFVMNDNTQNVGLKPGNDFSNNFVYSVIGGHGRPGHHVNKPNGFHGFVKEQEVNSDDKPLTFNDILLES